MKEYKRRLLQIAVPIMLSNLISNIQMLIDRIFLGRLDVLYVSAVGNATAPIWTTMSIVYSLAMGASILISQAVGEGKIEQAKEYAASLHIFHNIIPFILFLFWTFFSPVVFKLMGVAPTVMDYCVNYTRLFAPIYIVTGIGCSMMTMLQTSNYTKPFVTYGLIRSCLNIVLDYILIFGKLGLPAMGIAGAALGTTIAEYLGGIYIVIIVAKSKNLITKPSFSQIIHAKFSSYIRTLKLGVNSALEEFCWNIGNITLISLLNTISDTAAGIYSIVFSIEMIGGIVMGSLGSGTVTLTGEATGAKDIKTYRSVIKTSIFWACCVSAATLVLALIFPEQIVGIFTKDRSIIEGSHLYLALVCVNLFSKSTNVIVGSGIKGYGDTKWMFYTQLFGTVFIISLASLFILVFKWGMLGAIVAVLLDEFVRALINSGRLLRIKM